MEKFPVLETSRLVLREFCLTDAPAVFDIFSRTAVAQYINSEPMQRLEQAQEKIEVRRGLFERKIGFRWAITLQGQPGRVIGSCGFFLVHRRFRIVEIGYELHPDFWRQGYMFETLMAVIEFAFSQQHFFSINRIEALTYLDSPASIALLRKAGFLEEGVRREYGYWSGRHHDLRCFALLLRDWRQKDHRVRRRA